MNALPLSAVASRSANSPRLKCFSRSDNSAAHDAGEALGDIVLDSTGCKRDDGCDVEPFVVVLTAVTFDPLWRRYSSAKSGEPGSLSAWDGGELRATG